MSIVLSMFAQVLHLLLVLLAAPALAGLIGVLSRFLAGREGPPIQQPWRDLTRLFRKETVRAENASAVTRFAPLASVVLAALGLSLIPSFALGMVSAPLADVLSLAALFVLGRVVLVLAALDAGTGEGGVAATATTRLAMTAEPALLVAVFALALLAGGGDLDRIVAARMEGLLLPGSAGALAIAGLALLGWAESVRPSMEAAFSGRDLALVRVAEQLRLVAWCDLIGALALPFGMAAVEAGPMAWGIGLLAWAGRILLAALLLAGVRVFAPAHLAPAGGVLALAFCGVAAVLAMAGGAAP